MCRGKKQVVDPLTLPSTGSTPQLIIVEANAYGTALTPIGYPADSMH